MKKKTKMRLLSILLCFVMLVGLMPTTALAWTAPTLSGGKAEWNVKLSDEGVLTWNDMGSSTYDIQVDETTMGGTVTKIQGISSTSYNLINRFKELKIENGTYIFYINANDTDTTSGDITFRYVSPEEKLSEPQNLRWDGTVAKWDSVANATGYEVKLYSDSGSLQLSKTTTETQYDWSTNVYNDGFWFEVVAIGDNYRNSNAAESPKYGNYSWTAPTLSGGKAAWNVQLSDDGMLTWNDMGSATYDIYVDESAMGGTVTKIYSINTNAYNLINRFKTLKLENGTYYFTIKANDTDTTSGDIRITYVSPETKLSAPLNLRWEGTTAKWDSVVNATGYEVKLYSNSGSLQLTKTTTETQYDWSTNVYNDGFWFEVVATGNDYRGSNAAESPKYGTPLAPNTYTVTYDANGGNGSMGSDNALVDTDGFAKNYTFPQCAFTAPSGKEFDKWQWYYNSNPGNTNEITPGNSPWLSGSITVKALWKDMEGTYYTITYDANGGNGSMGSDNALVDTDGFAKNYTFPQCAFTAPSGKEFDKWQWYYNSNPGNTNEITPGNSPWLSGSITVKALWKDKVVKTHTISFDANGGTGTMQNVKYTSGDFVLPECSFTAPSGKKFVCWAKDSVDGTQYNVGATIPNINDSATFYAVWENALYQVSFDANGGEGEMTTINDAPGEYTLPSCGFSSVEGKYFAGWAVGDVNETPLPEGAKVNLTSDTIIYAIWNDNESYTVTYSDASLSAVNKYVFLAPEGTTITVKNFEDCGFTAPVGKTFSHWKEKWTKTDNIAPNIDYVVPDDDVYFEAQYVSTGETVYTIMFNSAGGEGTMDNVDIVAGSTYVLPICTFASPVGKLFKAWSVNGTEYQPLSSIVVNGHINIEPVWYEPESIRATYSQIIFKDQKIDSNHLEIVLVYDDGTTENISPLDVQYYDGTEVAPEYLINDFANYEFTQKGQNIITVKYGNFTEQMVIFVQVQHTISFNGNGAVGGSKPDMVVVEGTQYDLPENVFTAPSGKKFKCWSVNGEEKAVGATITVSSDTTITAVWESISETNYTITATAGENGNITPSGEVSVAKGSSKTFTITADSGYQIKDVKVNGTSIGAVSTYTFENISDNATISVEFDIDTVLHTCNPILVPKVEPNCITAGKSAYYHCECGKNYEDAQGNTAIADIETWGILNPLDHDYASAWSSDASGHWKICTRCSEKQNASAHTAGDWIVDKEATETEAGSKHKECSVCGYKVETAEIPKTGKQEETTPVPTEVGKLQNEKPVEPTPIPAAKGKVLTDEQGSNYKVTKSDAKNGEVTFAKPKRSVKGTVKIPDTVTIAGITYKVTAIEANAFKNNKNITKVIIGNNVKVIGKNAFAGCKKLKTITVKSTKLKSVGKKALKGIHAKAKIKVPKSKLAKYKRLFKNKGQSKNVKVTK